MQDSSEAVYSTNAGQDDCRTNARTGLIKGQDGCMQDRSDVGQYGCKYFSNICISSDLS